MEKATLIPFIILIALVLIVSLISKINFSNKLDIKAKIRLLPYWVKFMGIAIATLSVTINWINIYSRELLLAPFWQFGFSIGFLLICLSKEKNEDEMIMQIRLNTAFLSFFGGIILHLIILSINNLMGDENYISYAFISFSNVILLTYIFVFYSLKRKLKR